MTVGNVKYATYPSLDGAPVFVTGGADGIGRALVLAFAAQGSRVGFADINLEKAHEVVALSEEAGVSHIPLFYEIDLVDIEALQNGVAQAQRDLDGINVLVNNAANDDRHDWKDMTAEYWNDRLNTNLRHYFFAIQAVAPRMIEDGSGSIINVGSSSYLMQEDFFPGYAIAKSGVEGITRTMARTFGPHNVRVNTVLPGWVATERQLARWWTPEGEEQTIRDQAIKRRIYPEEFVQLVLFLAAADGAACTAQSFLVDGGRF
jgi:NAD(P)-dependent dehydrogenase (short-subunit alcohol dehydrogenase family)